MTSRHSIREIAVALMLLLGTAGAASAQAAKPAKPPKLPKQITLNYSTGQTKEPVFWATHWALQKIVKKRINPGPATPDMVAASPSADGGELYLAFVQYVGDEAMRVKLKSLKPVAYLGEGFALWGKDGQSTLGWWGFFAPPNTPDAIVEYYERSAAALPAHKEFKRLMKGWVKYYKTDPLPPPETQRPINAATLRAVLDAPPRVPTPAGIAAARARAAQLKAGPDYATTKRDAPPPAWLSVMLAIGGQAIAASAGNSALATAITPMLQSYAMAGAPPVDPNALAAINSFLTPMLETMNRSGLSVNTSSGFGTLLQPLQAPGAPPSPFSGVMKLLQDNAPPPADSSLVSLLQDMRAPGAPAMASTNPLTQALQSLTASPTGANQLLQTFQAAVGANSGVGQFLQGLQQGGLGAAPPAASAPTSSLTSSSPPASAAGAGAGGVSAGSSGGGSGGGLAAEVDRAAAGSSDPNILACAQQIKEAGTQYERAAVSIKPDETIPMIEALMWIETRVVEIIKNGCAGSPSFAEIRGKVQNDLNDKTTTCRQLSNTGSCVAQLPAR